MFPLLFLALSALLLATPNPLPLLQTSPLQELVNLLGSLGGLAALITVLINVMKKVGWVQDGTAPNWSLGLNLFAAVLLFVAKTFFPQIDIPSIDSILGSVASILTLVFGLILQLILSRKLHEGIRGTPLIGYSNSSKYSGW